MLRDVHLPSPPSLTPSFCAPRGWCGMLNSSFKKLNRGQGTVSIFIPLIQIFVERHLSYLNHPSTKSIMS